MWHSIVLHVAKMLYARNEGGWLRVPVGWGRTKEKGR